MHYRISELEELRMLLGKRHGSTEDVATVFKIMLENRCNNENKCAECSLCSICHSLIQYIEEFSDEDGEQCS